MNLIYLWPARTTNTVFSLGLSFPFLPFPCSYRSSFVFRPTDWVEGSWTRVQRAIQSSGGLVTGMFWGHVHTDQWTLARACEGDGDGDGDSDSCKGPPTAVMLAGPSLTEGFPATSPALRRLEFSTSGSWALEEAVTLSADIHDANRKNATELTWSMLYTFTEQVFLCLFDFTYF